jgi:lipoate-protein ligase A
VSGWSVRVDGFAPVAEVVRREGALLRAGAPAVHVAVVDGSAVSYGVTVPEDAPYLARARRLGVPTVGRTSGGTGVLHVRGDLVWAVILPRSDPRVGREFVRAYGRLGAGVVTALAERGIESRWQAAPGLSDDYCPLGPRGDVLSVGGRVVGAAAQHLTGTSLLHQGTVSVDIDRNLVRELFDFPDDAAVAHLTGLREHGVRAASATLAASVAEALVVALGPA